MEVGGNQLAHLGVSLLMGSLKSIASRLKDNPPSLGQRKGGEKQTRRAPEKVKWRKNMHISQATK